MVLFLIFVSLIPGLFGEVKWYVYSVEYQQRGLPHIHMVVSLKDHITTTEEADRIVSAELPPVPPLDHPQVNEKILFSLLMCVF